MEPREDDPESLTASGGWASPIEPLYDFPTLSVERGGLSYEDDDDDDDEFDRPPAPVEVHLRRRDLTAIESITFSNPGHRGILLIIDP